MGGDQMEDETYCITNLDGYVGALLSGVQEEMGPPDNQSIYSFITKAQVLTIIEEQCLGYTENNEPIINNDAHAKIIEDIIYRVENTALAQLASDGFLDCAWDDELNDMVFWLSDKGEEHNRIHS